MMFVSRSSTLAALSLAALLAGCSRSPQVKAAQYIETGKKHVQSKDYARALVDFKNAVKAAPKNAEAYYQLALVYLQIGDPQSAFNNLKQASDVDSTHVAARLKMAELMAASRSTELVKQAGEKAQEILTLSPDNPDALHLLAITELRQGKSTDAIQHLEQALKKMPQHLVSSVTLARVKLAQKDLAGAEEILKKAAGDPKSVEAQIVMGRFYLLQQKTAEAEARFRQALTIDPNSAPALLDLANLQFRQGRKEEADKSFVRLSQLPDKQYRPMHAIFLFESGSRDQAIAEFVKQAEADPKDRPARNRLVLAYLATNKIPEAEKVLAGALKRSGKDVDALEQRARIYLATQRIEEAKKDAAQILALKPESAMGHYLLAKVHQNRGAAPAYKQELSEALRLSPALLAARIELSQYFRATRAPKTARDLMDKMPEGQKPAAAALAERNWVLLDLGNDAETRQAIDQALKMGRLPEFLLQDAALKIRQKNFVAAQASLEESLKQNPVNLRALELLGGTYAAQKQIPQAVRKVREYVALNPKSAVMQQFLGGWLVRTGDTKGAREAFLAAKTLDPKFIQADLALAQLDVGEGKRADARKSLNQLLTANPASTGSRLLLAMVEELDGNRAVAIDYYRKVIAAEPNNILAVNNLAYLLADFANQPDEALRLAQQAKEAAPESSAIDDTIGWAYYQKGIYQSAVTHLESAVNRGSSAVKNYHLAMAHYKMGNRDRAQKYLQTALKQDPGIPEAKAALDLMAGGK
ncbi:MAG: tetratricopeptide repeat protein [Acidobacteria bacterium]|nr:tetratricopeptide repeat protein [Acidobacteriota bacterium]